MHYLVFPTHLPFPFTTQLHESLLLEAKAVNTGHALRARCYAYTWRSVAARSLPPSSQGGNPRKQPTLQLELIGKHPRRVYVRIRCSLRRTFLDTAADNRICSVAFRDYIFALSHLGTDIMASHRRPAAPELLQDAHFPYMLQPLVAGKQLRRLGLLESKEYRAFFYKGYNFLEQQVLKVLREGIRGHEDVRSGVIAFNAIRAEVTLQHYV